MKTAFFRLLADEEHRAGMPAVWIMAALRYGRDALLHMLAEYYNR
jgi:hypothetical protein